MPDYRMVYHLLVRNSSLSFVLSFKYIFLCACLLFFSKKKMQLCHDHCILEFRLSNFIPRYVGQVIIIIIESIVPSRNIGCLWVLSTSVCRLLRTLVHSSFYPLPWLPIFSSYFSVFLSSCFPEGSRVGQPLVFLHLLFLMCDRSI